MQPRVDIIIPVFNVEAYLRRCLDSISSQTCPLWRAICIDDDSSDGSLDILKEYSSADPRFEVAHVKHRGLSCTRNIGLQMADSEFMMFVDPDDSLHPQTVEIALALADRDGSDVVSWRRDRVYMNIQVRYMRLLHMDTVSSSPWGKKKTYSLDSFKTMVTEDLLDHCSDWNHPHGKFIVKHCQVWKQLYRRESISGIEFQEGLNFEDIPWWSEALLRPLRATLTTLPLYFYYTNPQSIVRSMSEIGKAHDMLKGVLISYDLYCKEATPSQMSTWSHNIKWAILHRLSRKVETLSKEDYEGSLRKLISDLREAGAFDDASSSKEIRCRDRFYRI